MWQIFIKASHKRVEMRKKVKAKKKTHKSFSRYYVCGYTTLLTVMCCIHNDKRIFGFLLAVCVHRKVDVSTHFEIKTANEKEVKVMHVFHVY